MLTISCHCGAIRLEFARRPRKLTQCNCSICRRYGAIWAYYRRKSVQVACRRSALAVYSWGHKGRQFYRCKNCGSVTHYRSEEHTSELQSLRHLVCRLLLEKKNNNIITYKVIYIK